MVTLFTHTHTHTHSHTHLDQTLKSHMSLLELQDCSLLYVGLYVCLTV